MKLRFAELTDIGLVRKANEDSVGHLLLGESNTYGNIYIVCDGMGGHVGGAKASQSAVKNIKEYFLGQPNSNPQIALKESIEFANMQIFAEAQSNPDFSGMGTTVTVLLEKDGFINIAHVGDSRVYINSNGVLSRITKDHSFVQGLVDAGQLKDEEMEDHARKNELTRALGISSTVEVEVNSIPILAKRGDKFMLCSDGLCGLVNDTTMMNTINDEKIIKSAANKLIELAKNAGGHDNISVTIIEVLESIHSKSQFTDKSNVKIKANKSITSTRQVDPKELAGGVSEKYKVLVKNIALPALISIFVLVAGYFGWNMLDKDPKNKGNSGNSGEVETPLVEDENAATIEHKLVNENFEEGSIKIKEKINSLNLGYTYDDVKEDYIEFIIENERLLFLEAKQKYYSSTSRTFNDASLIFYKVKYEESLVNEGITSIQDDIDKEEEAKEVIRNANKAKLNNAKNKLTEFNSFLEENKKNDYLLSAENKKFGQFKKAKREFKDAIKNLQKAHDDKDYTKLDKCISEVKVAKSAWEETFKKDSDAPDPDEDLVQEYKEKIEDWESYQKYKNNDESVIVQANKDLPLANCDKEIETDLIITITKGDKTVTTPIKHTTPKKSDDECNLEQINNLKSQGYKEELYDFDSGEHTQDIYQDTKVVGGKTLYLYRKNFKIGRNETNLNEFNNKYIKEVNALEIMMGNNEYEETDATAGDLEKFFCNKTTYQTGQKWKDKELDFLKDCGAQYHRIYIFIKKEQD